MADARASFEEQVREVLETLHAATTPPDVRRHAGEWLQLFQASGEAWQLCTGLLMTEEGGVQEEVKLFAAQTLKLKVFRELRGLERQHWPQLREVLLRCVQVNAGKGPKELSTQLFLGVVGLVLEWEEWEDALQDVESRTTMTSFLGFLRVLAEEACGNEFKLTGRLEELSLARHRVRSWSGSILTHLVNLWGNLYGSEEITCALDCFTAWIQLGALDATTVEAYEGIASSCFDYLSADISQVCEAAERSVLAMAEFAPTALMERLVEHMVNLSVKAADEVAAGRTDSKVFRTYFQLFGECLMTNLDRMTCNDEKGKMLREAFVRALSFPYASQTAVVPFLEVCGAFAHHIAEITETENKQGYIEKNEQLALLESVLKETVPRMGFICRHKQENGVLALTMQEVQLNICEVLGGETYIDWVIKFMSTPSESSGPIWENIESGLYCSEAIAPFLCQIPAGGHLALPLLHNLPHIQALHGRNYAPAMLQAISSCIIALIDIALGEDLDLNVRQNLFFGLVGLLIQGLDVQGARQDCAFALQRLFSTAVQNGVRVPLDCVTSLMHKAEEHGHQSQHAGSLLAAIITGVHSLEDMQSSVTRKKAAYLVFSPIHNVLESAVNELCSGGSLEMCESKIAPMMQLTKTVLEVVVSCLWESDRESQLSDTMNPLLLMFANTIWPLLVQICLNGAGAECMALTADCATLSLPNFVAATSPILPGLFEICQARVAYPGGHCFLEPLGVAAELVAGNQYQIEGLMSSVESIWSLGVLKDSQMINESQLPGITVAVLNLLGHIIRFHESFPADRVSPVILAGLECTVSQCGCHDKEVGMAAVSCLRSLLYCAVDSGHKCMPLVRWVEENGSHVMQGLIGGVLAPGSLSRIHRITCVLVLLAMVLGQSDNKGTCQFHEWLKNALGVFEAKGLSSDLVADAMYKWTPIFVSIWERGIDPLHAASGRILASKEGRQLKKLVREFAERQGSNYNHG